MNKYSAFRSFCTQNSNREFAVFSSLFCFWIQLFITAATFCQVFAKREKINKNRNLHSKVLGETKQCTKQSGVRKGQCHDIFTPPGPPHNVLKYFRFWFSFARSLTLVTGELDADVSTVSHQEFSKNSTISPKSQQKFKLF